MIRRGERMARWLLDKLDQAGADVEFVQIDGEWAIKVLNPRPQAPEVIDAVTDLTLMAIGYPRNFGTLRRLHGEREAAR